MIFGSAEYVSLTAHHQIYPTPTPLNFRKPSNKSFFFKYIAQGFAQV